MTPDASNEVRQSAVCFTFHKPTEKTNKYYKSLSNHTMSYLKNLTNRYIIELKSK
jgi:hypothetical protein